jgi:hypothetical protein
MHEKEQSFFNSSENQFEQERMKRHQSTDDINWRSCFSVYCHRPERHKPNISTMGKQHINVPVRIKSLGSALAAAEEDERRSEERPGVGVIKPYPVIIYKLGCFCS